MSNLSRKELEIQLIEKHGKNPMLDMGFTPEKFQKEAMHVCSIWNDPKNSYLRKGSMKSLIQSVVSIASTGLTLNPIAKEAFLIPRYSKDAKGIEISLEPSYIGLLKLLTDSGSVKNLQVNLVYDGDKFEVNLGMDTEIKHSPYYVEGKEKGGIKGVYAVAYLKDTKQYEYMTREEIERIRDTSQSYIAYKDKNTKSCIWVDHEGEMFRKTCVRRISKYLPRSEQYQQAEQLLNRDFEATLNQISMIDSLLISSTIPETEKDRIESELGTLTYHSAKECIKYLQENQFINIGDDINRPNHLGETQGTKQFDRIMNDPAK